MKLMVGNILLPNNRFLADLNQALLAKMFAALDKRHEARSSNQPLAIKGSIREYDRVGREAPPFCRPAASAESTMNVLFVGFGITPYYRDFLNRIQTQGHVHVTNVRPSGENRHLGAGVHQDFSEIRFSDVQLKERHIVARRLFGLSDFERRPSYNSFAGLAQLIRRLHPHVIVVNTNYHAAFCFDSEITAAVRRVRAKCVFHSIPFRLPTYEEALASIELPNELPMRSLPAAVRRVVRSLQMDALYLRLIRRNSLERSVEFKRKVLNLADALTVYYEGGVDIYRSYGVPVDRIRVVRNSPNTDKLLDASKHFSRCDSGSRLIHVGRLVEWKRVDLLIQAVAILRSNGFPDSDLVVIGDGPCEGKLRELAKKLNVEEAVYFRGGVYDPGALAKEYSSSSIYVLAGMGGLSINEAMCFSMPVVCSKCDGTEKFLVRDGVNGLYFREGDLESLVEKLTQLLSDCELRQQFGRRSRRIIEEEINTQIHVSNYLELFQDLAECSAGG